MNMNVTSLFKKANFRRKQRDAFSLMLTMSLFFSHFAGAQETSNRQYPRASGISSFMTLEEQKKLDTESFYAQFLNGFSPQGTDLTIQSKETQFFEWIPHGGLISAVPPRCRPEVWEMQIKSLELSPRDFSVQVQKYFDQCGPYLNSRAPQGILSLLDFSLVSYPILENSRIQAFSFETQKGRYLNGFIGVKDQTPRPWVLLKCGVFCEANPNNISIKNYVINLFDQTPFNLIVLGNRTGEDYIANNKVFSMAGYDESEDLLEVAEWLRTQSSKKELVSSLHIVTLSLGSSAALMLEKKLSEGPEEQREVVQSISALCGVADLKSTMKQMFVTSIKGYAFTEFTWDKLTKARSKLPEVDYLLNREKPEAPIIPGLLGRMTAEYLLLEREKQGELVEDRKALLDVIEKEFWQNNDRSNDHYEAKVPLLVWASKDDSVVPFSINTGKLSKTHGLQAGPLMGIVKVPYGDHCGFSTAYGYSVVSTVLRSFILSQSPEFSDRIVQQTIPAPFSFTPMNRDERLINFWWNYGKDNLNSIVLNMELSSVGGKFCTDKNLYSGAEFCGRVVKRTLPIALFEDYGFKKPKNQVEKEALVRELNGRAGIGYQHQPIIGENQWPDQILVYF